MALWQLAVLSVESLNLKLTHVALVQVPAFPKLFQMMPPGRLLLLVVFKLRSPSRLILCACVRACVP